METNISNLTPDDYPVSFLGRIYASHPPSPLLSRELTVPGELSQQVQTREATCPKGTAVLT